MLDKLCRRCKKIIKYPNTYCEVCKEIKERKKEERKLSYSFKKYFTIYHFQIQLTNLH